MGMTDRLLIISGISYNFKLQHFKNICTTMGKPQEFHVLLGFQPLLKRSIIVSFNSVNDKRHFMHVFRVVFPDLTVQEIFKALKVFSWDPTLNPAAVIAGLKTEGMHVAEVRESFGEEFLMTDFRLAKHPDY